MNQSNVCGSAQMATASRLLIVARDLSDLALRLRATAAELLEASPLPIATADAGLRPGPARAAAVDICTQGQQQQRVGATLGVGKRRARATTTQRQTVITTTIDDANAELAACNRYGAWSPPPPRARAARK